MPHAYRRKVRRQPPHHIHTGLHHGSGVQVGRHRGGCRHRAGQPKVERCLRRLRQRAEQNEQHRRRDPRDVCQVGQARDLRELPHIRLRAKQDDAHQHGQPTKRGDQQRLRRRPSRRRALPVIGDEEEGEHGGDLPEDVHHQDVVRDHQTVHHRGKHGELRREDTQTPRIRVKIAPAIQQHQGTNAQDDQPKQPRERIEPELNIQVHPRHPYIRGQDLAPVMERPRHEVVHQPEKPRRRHHSQQTKSGPAQRTN